MGNVLYTCRNEYSSNEKEKQLGLRTRIKNISTSTEEIQLEKILNNYKSVVHSYIGFLQTISRVIFKKQTNDVEREKRKFLSVKKEFSYFLAKHRNFYTLKSVHLTNEAAKYEIAIDASYDVDRFINLYDAYELKLKFDAMKNKPGFKVNYEINQNNTEITKRLKSALEKPVISESDVNDFLKSNMLVGKNDYKDKFSSYKELSFYIRTRCDSYYNCKVCPAHIDKISFKFKGPIDNFEGENSCAVCLEGYEIDQEVCRLPCDHFCCRSCTVEMFNIPNNGSRANFQCPICRDDCS